MKKFQTPLLGIAVLAVLASCEEASAPISEPVVVGEMSGDAAGVADVMAEPALAAPSPVSAERVIAPIPDLAPSPGQARAGVVTAGDIDDGLNLAAFTRYLSEARSDTGLPRAALGTPFVARLIGADGQPAPGQRITLRRQGADTPFYDGYSGVDGRIVVFPGIHGAGNLRRAELRVFAENAQVPHSQSLRAGQGADVQLPFSGGWEPDFMDLTFVVDTTGSMADELNWLTAEMTGIVNRAQRAAPGVDIRYGLVVYRDQGDAYVVRNFGFTTSQREMRSWLQAQSANGGGDYPEAAADALQSAVDMQWRRGQGERLLFHIADAPPHDRDADDYLDAAAQAAQQGVQIFGLGASGVAAESEYLMRQAAAQTNGRYLFLTDDSGVGLSHAEPTISCYRITALKDLVQRVIASELSGRRMEARDGDVIRTVGSYRGGVCVN